MRRKKFRRRNKVIKPRFQLKMAVSAFVFVLMYSLVLGWAIFHPLAAEYSATVNTDDKAMLAFSALKIHENLWPVLLCITILVFVGTIFFSHRIAGPMYRFERTVETLTEGNFSIRTRLRKGDEFHEFAGLLNNLAVSLENRQAEESFFRNECKELLNQLVGKPAIQYGNEAEQLQAIMDQLMAKFNAPIGELAPNPTILSKDTQNLSSGSVHDQSQRIERNIS